MTELRDSVYPGWKPLAERTREALALLGYQVPACLPGEPEACGENFVMHAVGNLAALKAVVEVHIAHLDAEAMPMVDGIYANTLANLRAEPPCEQGHQVGGDRS